MIDMKKLKALVKLMVENDLTELDLQDDAGEKVTLKRGSDEGAGPVQYVPAPAAAPAAPAAPAPSAPAEGGEGEGGEEKSGPAITSPMVGTFYAAPNPDSEPFVKVGDKVDEETVVCIIEAMKVFNEIKAEASGTIEKILVGNGQAVEFGEPLFRIKPD